MVEGIIGVKKGMTQIFDDDGKRIPVTVIEAGPCRVVQIKTKENDGYEAVQLGFGEKKHSRVNKAERGHAKKANMAVPRLMKEFMFSGDDTPEKGQEIGADMFQVGDLVDIAGLTKGKGFQGVIKRYGFRGGPGGHGSMFHRAPGAIGCRNIPGRVFKGKKMGGHMGVRRRTTQRLKVVMVDTEKNLIAVKGSVPGHTYSYLEIRKTIKPRKK